MIIVFPMAGRGKRFQDSGFTTPKPLIDIEGKPMFQLVVENLNLSGKHIFICQEEHYKKYALNELIDFVKKDSEIITVNKITQGTAMTVLLAKDKINNDEELIITNSDQIVDWDSQHFLSFIRKNDVDGCIVTFTSTNPKWSFVKLDENGNVTKVVEKRPISNIATAGIYYFKHGKDFVEAAKSMIEKNLSVNNEFYVAPTFNEMIEKGKKIIPYPIAEMRGLGTPEDLQKYIKTSQLSKKENELK